VACDCDRNAVSASVICTQGAGDDLHGKRHRNGLCRSHRQLLRWHRWMARCVLGADTDCVCKSDLAMDQPASDDSGSPKSDQETAKPVQAEIYWVRDGGRDAHLRGWVYSVHLPSTIPRNVRASKRSAVVTPTARVWQC